MNAYFTNISLAARLDCLPELLSALAEAAGALDLPADVIHRLQLVAEELFVNTVSHGFGGDHDSSVVVRLGRHGADTLLTYSDGAPPFDPLARPFNEARPSELGGAGLALLRGLTRQLSYRREDGRNICEMRF